MTIEGKADPTISGVRSRFYTGEGNGTGPSDKHPLRSLYLAITKRGKVLERRASGSQRRRTSPAFIS